MNYFQALPIDTFISNVCQQDRDITKLLEGWNVELEEIIRVMTAYYRDLGVYTVQPLDHATIIKKDLLSQLKNNKALKQKLHAVHQESKRLKKNTQ